MQALRAELRWIANAARCPRGGGSLGLAVCLSLPVGAEAQRPQLSNAVRQFAVIDTPVVALTHARVIDGTGAPARPGQTLVLRNGGIAAVGDDGAVQIPDGALVMDLAGKSVLPGLVHMHEHLFYPNGSDYPNGAGIANTAESFSRLYLAAGVTSIRTAGASFPYTDIRHKEHIDAGRRVGPWIDVVGPYLEGPGGVGTKYILKDAGDATKFVNFWVDAGATSFKAYKSITRAQLAAAIKAAHARGVKVTADLCSVTFREAAEMGIDNLEHGYFVASDFLPNKTPDVCTGGQGAIWPVNAALKLDSPPVRELIGLLVSKKVALTSTLPVLEALVPGTPLPPGVLLLAPTLRDRLVERYVRRGGASGIAVMPTLFPKVMQFELAFARAGGLLLAGTDPTGTGVIIPGDASHRQLELQVQAGFTPLEAIKISTLNGATYLGRADRIGSIAPGKQADLVIVTGDPSVRISDIRNVEIVFKQGIAYSPGRLIDSVRGYVGIW